MSLLDFVNDRAVLMRGTVPRNTNPRASKFLILQAVPPVFHVAANGTVSPATVTLTASLYGIPGAVAWSAVDATLSGAVDNVRTIAAADMAGASASVSVQISYQGEIYTANQIIQKVVDGAPGSPAQDGARGAGSFYGAGNAWSDAVADAATPGGNVLDDTVTIYNNSTFVQTKRWDGTAWVGLGAGTLDGARLSPDSIAASMLKAGIIDVAKFAAGIEPVSMVTAVPATRGTNAIFNTTDGKLYRWNGSAYETGVAAADVSGTLANAQIASLAASKVTGQLSDAQLSAIAAAKISGQLTDAQVAELAATKITGTLSDTQLAAIAAAKVTGQIVGTQITNGAISTQKLAAGAVTANEIAANTITAAKIAASAITATELAAGSVTTVKLVAGAVTANEMAAGSVTTAKLAAGAVTANEIAANTITAAKVAAGAITATELAAGAVIAGKIAAGTIVAADIAADTITAAQIAANAITATELAADSVTAGKIAAAAISAREIAAGAVTTDTLVVGAGGGLASTLIRDGAITTQKMTAASINADRLSVNTLTGDRLVAGAITADKINVTSLSAVSSNFGSVNMDGAGILQGGAFVTKPAGQEWPNAGAGSGYQIGNGAMRLGNFNDGKFIFIGYDGNLIGPNFSIVDGVPHFSNGTISTATINTPVINNPTLSGIGAGSLSPISSTGGGTARTLPSRTAAGSGGQEPYKYHWYLDGDEGVVITGGANTATVSLFGSVPANPDALSATLYCEVTDAGGRTGITECNVDVYFT